MILSEVFHNTRPKGILLPQEITSFETLEKLGIDYDCVSCNEPADTMEKCEFLSEKLNVSICKNLFLCNRQKTEFYFLCMEPNKPFHTKDLSQQINSSRLSFAPEEFLKEFLHCSPGSASILGLVHDTSHRVHLLMERDVYEAEFFGCHPCLCTSALKLRTKDILQKFLPQIEHEPTIVNL